ncbi:hypothetical protein MVEN_01768400 [Mycena venus]|uniref:Uncharacterized protein n=1 Tax=Mycena venus TaxID=2733690 RepID=A0A8H7CPB7_9AGAR|nr:hypothetical protein MVEN_01768400 [Mycena venus]
MHASSLLQHRWTLMMASESHVCYFHFSSYESNSIGVYRPRSLTLGSQVLMQLNGDNTTMIQDNYRAGRFNF